MTQTLPPTPSVPRGQPTSGATTHFEYKIASAPAVNVAITPTAAAAVGARTLAVAALTGDVPAGFVIHYTYGDVVTTAPATAGALSLSVEPLEFPLATSDAASYDGFITPPVMGEAMLALTPGTTNYDALASSNLSVWGYAVKTGMGGTITVRSAAPDNDPAIQPLVQAGLATGPASVILFRQRRSSGTWYTGAAVIGFQPADPTRGVTEATFTGPTTGKIEATFAPYVA